jgi:hypothetical protein
LFFSRIGRQHHRTAPQQKNSKGKQKHRLPKRKKRTMITIASHRKAAGNSSATDDNAKSNTGGVVSSTWQPASASTSTPKRKADAIASGAPSTPINKLANKSTNADAKPTIPSLALASTSRPTVTFSNLLETPRAGVRSGSAVSIISELKQTVARGGATLNHLENSVGKPLATLGFALGEDDVERRGLKSLFAQIKVLAAGYSRVGAKLVEIDAPSAALELVRRFLELFAEPMVRFVTSVATERANLQALYQFVELKPHLFPELPAHDDGSLADRSLHGHFMLPLRLLRAISELVVDADAIFGGEEATLAKRVLTQLAAIRAQMREAAQTAVTAEPPVVAATATTPIESAQTPKPTRPATLQRRQAPQSERRSSTASSNTAAVKQTQSMRFTPKRSSHMTLPMSPDSPPPPPPPTTPLSMLRGTLKRARTPLSPLFDANNNVVDLSDIESCVTASPNKQSRKWHS